MTGYANAYEMKMPANYVDMTRDEMQYDGGWFLDKLIRTAAAVFTIVGCATVAMGTAAYCVATGGVGVFLGGAAVCTGCAYVGVRAAEEIIDIWTE